MLNVQRKNLGTVSLLNLDGNVVIGETEKLRDVFQTLPASSSVILDLSHVRLLDEHGLGVLLHLREQAQGRDMQLELANIGDHLRELFRITRLDSVFQISSGAKSRGIAARPHRTPIAA